MADKVAERVLVRLQEEPPRQAHDGRWLTSAEAATHLGITKNALYKLTSARTIPFEQDTAGGRMYFDRQALDEWRRGHR